MRQLSILREEAVTGMQCITTGFDGQVDQLAWVQIARQGITAHIVGFVGTFDVQGVAVCVGVNRDRSNAHLCTGANDANRNLAAVGNQNFLDHVRFPRGGDRVVARKRLRITAPVRGRRVIHCKIFLQLP